MSSHRLRNWMLLAGSVLFLFAIDQGSKWLVVQNLAIGESWAPIPALSRLFTITHVRNTGVAFGQLQGLGWLFMAVNLVVLIGVLVYYPRIPSGQWPMRLASALIMAGALGNVVDRLRTASIAAQVTGSLLTALPHAYVTDFFDVKIWPVWNFADMYVVSGTIILAWILWRSEDASTAGDTVTGKQS